MFAPRTYRHVLLLLTILTLASISPVRAEEIKLTDVFIAGQEGYKSFRIPALICTKKGTLLAFCEGRKHGISDAGDIDLVMKRSTDGGATWSKLQVVWDDAEHTCGNPCPVVDQITGTIWLSLTWNDAKDNEESIKKGTSKHPRRAFVSHSTDDGQSWAKPIEISDTVRKPHWRWYATGPGIGIQVMNGKHKGRLVIPANHSDHSDPKRHFFRAHVFYSDDQGKNWKLGGVHDEKTNESTIVELEDGTLLDNMRSYHGKNRRAIATSGDGGETWSAVTLDDKLIEPVCQASILRYYWPEKSSPGAILFANPASTKRERMTIRASFDDGKTWPVELVVYAGSSAYSSLECLPHRSVGLLFERDNYKKISLAVLTGAKFEPAKPK